MSTKTTNYSIVKPADNETADIQVINANMDIIDAKLKEVDNKASNITVPVTKVNNKTGDVVLTTSDIKAADGATVETHLAGMKTQADITYYVATTGNDTTGDGTVEKPFKTIQFAINKLPQLINHDVKIYIAPGNYSENLNIRGFIGKGSITIIGGTKLTEAINYIIKNIVMYSNQVGLIVLGLTANSTIDFDFSFYNCSKVDIKYCRAIEIASSISCVNSYYSNVFLYSCEFSNHAVAITASNCTQLISQINIGTGNNVSLSCTDSTIMKHGSQPSGTTAELIGYGGVIR